MEFIYDSKVMLTAKSRIDPQTLARDHSKLSGRMKCADLGRFASLLVDRGGVVRYDLNFASDECNRPLVRGKVTVEVTVICQRCLEPMDLVVATDVRLAGVHTDEQAKALPGEFEPLLLTDRGVTLATLVENELLLALPAAPTHGADSDCALPRRYRPLEASTPVKPFADLAVLKERLN